jgi:uncharacterized protein (TIGR02001 family)
MIFTKKVNSLRVLSVAVAASVVGLAAPLAAQADVTGNISVVSKYVLRGMTNSTSFATEADFGAVQGGFDYSHSSGIYLGYWGSSLSYNSPTRPEPQTTGFESDIYGGYKFKAGPVDLNFGVIQYLYTGIDDGDGIEGVFAAGFGPVTAGLKYLAKDVFWGNTGDIYWTLGYSQKLPMDFKFDGVVGYYTYSDSGDFIPTTVNSSAFRHVDLKVSHPLGKSGFDMSLTYIVGGEDRQAIEQGNAIVLGLASGF